MRRRATTHGLWPKRSRPSSPLKEPPPQPGVRSFSAAGILHEIWLGATPVYRRRPETDYLAEDPETAPTDIDAVCGMLAPADSPHREPDADGIERRFCSARCRAAFIAFPGLFGPGVHIDDGGSGG